MIKVKHLTSRNDKLFTVNNVISNINISFVLLYQIIKHELLVPMLYFYFF